MRQRIVNTLLGALIFPYICTHAWLFSRQGRAATTARFAAAKSKFSQPAFSQAAHQSNNNNKNSGNNKTPHSTRPLRKADSKIGQLHQERVRTAGRVGTKRFVDPCKVFLGNLPFDADEAAVKAWVCDKMGLPPAVLLRDVKVVMDWKTGKSKGYAFVDFTEAIYGTVCIDTCNNQDFGGRAVRVDQGKKKPDETAVYLQKKKKKAVTDEEAAIQAGMAQAEEDQKLMLMDAEEYALIRRLDPDLVETATFKYNVDDDLLEEEEDEDDDDGVDGFWYGDEEEEAEIVEFDEDGFTKPMNREQRRDAARRTKRRKLPHKGFGEPPSD